MSGMYFYSIFTSLIIKTTKAMINYEKLMFHNPTEYDRMINSLGQEIVFYEHPLRGDEVEVICVCHDLQLAAYSTFFETTDMMEDHKEYEPTFVDGKLLIGGFVKIF